MILSNELMSLSVYSVVAFENSILLDLGCGSRPALSYFSENNEKHCSDPLLDDFLNIEKTDCGCPQDEQKLRVNDQHGNHRKGCSLPGHTKFHKRYKDKPDINVRNWFEEEDYELYSLPYEEFILPLENKVDFLLCWNVLDHGYDWRAGVENIIKYVKTDGILLLATDFERHQFHIGIDNPSELKDMIEDNFEIIQTVGSGLVVNRDYMVLGKKK